MGRYVVAEGVEVTTTAALDDDAGENEVKHRSRQRTWGERVFKFLKDPLLGGDALPLVLLGTL